LTCDKLINFSEVYRLTVDLKHSGKRELIARLNPIIKDQWIEEACDLKALDQDHPKWKLLQAIWPNKEQLPQREPGKDKSLKPGEREQWLKLLESEDFLKALEDQKLQDDKTIEFRNLLISFLCSFRSVQVLQEAGGDLERFDDLLTCKKRKRLLPYKWVLGSQGFDAMCEDFMAPLLRGALSPLFDRGDALALFWTDELKWRDSTNIRGYGGGQAKGGYQAQYPVLLLNACDATRGSRLVIGFPSLPRDLWSKTYAGRENSYEKPQTLSRLCPDLELSLSRAVRLSSNFPWGLRVQNLPGLQGDRRDPLHVLDGGVVDNTGLDTIYALFDAIRFHAQEPSRSRPESPNQTQPTYPEEENYFEEATAILKELWTRGIVIVEIDAGAKPNLEVPRRSVAYLWEPGQSLTNATYTNGALTRKLYIDETNYILTPPGKRSSPKGPDSLSKSVKGPVFSVTLACNHYRSARGNSHDVMTAWALGPEDKAQVLFRFLIELKQWEFQWRDMFQILAEKTKRGRQALALLEKTDQMVGNLTDQKRELKEKDLTAELRQLEENFKEIGKSLATLKDRTEVDKLQKQFDEIRKKLLGKAGDGDKKKWVLGEPANTFKGLKSQIATVNQELKKEAEEQFQKDCRDLQERLDRRAKFSRDAFDRPPTAR
jgi:hypothetical protein